MQITCAWYFLSAYPCCWHAPCDKCNFRQKTTIFRYFAPPLGSLGVTYDVHLRLIGKHVVNFLLVLKEILSLRVTAEAL